MPDDASADVLQQYLPSVQPGQLLRSSPDMPDSRVNIGDHRFDPRSGSWTRVVQAETKHWRGFPADFRNCGAVPEG